MTPLAFAVSGFADASHGLRSSWFSRIATDMDPDVDRQYVQTIEMLLEAGGKPGSEGALGTILINVATAGANGDSLFGDENAPRPTPATIAALAETLIAAGADVNQHYRSRLRSLSFGDDEPSSTPLFVAMLQASDPGILGYETVDGAERCRAEALVYVPVLLKHGVDVNATDEHGETALQAAIGVGEPQLVRLLLDHGADVNGGAGVKELFYRLIDTRENFRTPAEHYQVAQMLVERGARFTRQQLHDLKSSLPELGEAGTPIDPRFVPLVESALIRE
jgi:hypothetical protein